MGKSYTEIANFDDTNELVNYGCSTLKEFYAELERLKCEHDIDGHFLESTLAQYRVLESTLKYLIIEGRDQLTDYLISKAVVVDKLSKEELISFRERVVIFNSRLNLLSETLDKANEEIWTIMGSYAKHWRIK